MTVRKTTPCAHCPGTFKESAGVNRSAGPRAARTSAAGTLLRRLEIYDGLSSHVNYLKSMEPSKFAMIHGDQDNLAVLHCRTATSCRVVKGTRKLRWSLR